MTALYASLQLRAFWSPINKMPWVSRFIIQSCMFCADEAYGSWSVLGSIAKHVAKDKPTMSFNFSNMKSEDIKITIIHQFGHALGFGHAMMRPEDWEVLKEFVDIKEMVRCYDARNEEDFEVLWTGKELSEDVVNYDEGSVMQYR